MKTDMSDKFITIPSDYPLVKDFDVAQTLPSVDVAIVQLDPFYLPEFDTGGTYGGWGDVTKGPMDVFTFPSVIICPMEARHMLSNMTRPPGHKVSCLI